MKFCIISWTLMGWNWSICHQGWRVDKWTNQKWAQPSVFIQFPFLFHLSVVPPVEDECIPMHVPPPCCSALKSYKPLNCFRFPLLGKNHVSLSNHAESAQVHCVTVSYDWMFQVTWVKQKKIPLLTKSTPVLWSAESVSGVCQKRLWQDGAVCGHVGPH